MPKIQVGSRPSPNPCTLVHITKADAAAIIISINSLAHGLRLQLLA
jgi:hypothetical protein